MMRQLTSSRSPAQRLLEEAKALEGEAAAAAAQRQQSPAEMSECSSDISSSASVAKEAAPMVPPAATATPGPRTKPWSLNTKNLKVILHSTSRDEKVARKEPSDAWMHKALFHIFIKEAFYPENTTRDRTFVLLERYMAVRGQILKTALQFLHPSKYRI